MKRKVETSPVSVLVKFSSIFMLTRAQAYWNIMIVMNLRACNECNILLQFTFVNEGTFVDKSIAGELCKVVNIVSVMLFIEGKRITLNYPI